MGVLSFVSCNKATLSEKPSSEKTASEKIIGKWRYTQSFYSIGGPLIYMSTDSLGQWIEFKANGVFKSNMPLFQNVTSYEIIDSSRFKFITPLQQPRFHLFFISLDPADNTLSLSPADVICIEGCGNKFKR